MNPALMASVPSSCVEVVGGAPPGPRHALAKRPQRHPFDLGEHRHEVGRRRLVEGSDAEPAVAREHRGHAVQGRRTQVGIPERLCVEVGVHVDEAGRHDATIGVDDSPGRRRRSNRSRRCVPSTMPTSAATRSPPVPSMTSPFLIIRSSISTSSVSGVASCGDQLSMPKRCEAVAVDRVAACEQVGLVLVETGASHEAGEHGLRVRPGRITVRVVGLEHDLTDADPVADLQPDEVVEDAPVDPSRDVAARRTGRAIVQVAVDGTLLPHAVEPLDDERHPSDLTLAERHPQTAEPLEHAARQPVGQGVGRTLVGQRQRHGSGRVDRRHRERRRRADVQVDHRVGVLAGGEEGVPVRGVDARQLEPSRVLGEGDGERPLRCATSHLRRSGDSGPTAGRASSGSGDPGRRRRTTRRSSSRCRPGRTPGPSSRSGCSRNVWPQKRGNVGKASDASVWLASRSASRAACS